MCYSVSVEVFRVENGVQGLIAVVIALVARWCQRMSFRFLIFKEPCCLFRGFASKASWSEVYGMNSWYLGGIHEKGSKWAVNKRVVRIHSDA